MDLNALRSKLTQLQSSTQKQDRLWKPEPGKNTIRIVPYQFNKDNPFTEMYFHYDLGKKSNYLSPITYGNADPVVEFAEKLKKTGDSNDWKMGRKLEPKMRTYVPIIVRGKENEGVKYWGFGKQVYQELLGFIADEDYGDITDVKNGRDVVVEFIKPEDAGNTFGKITIRVKPNATPATDSKEVAEKIVNGQKDLKEIFPEPSYDTLKEALEKFLDPDSTVEEPKANAKSEDKPATKKPAANSKDVASSFDELFNK
jgi:hypothetical protein